MSQNQQIFESLDTCQHYINEFLKHAYALDAQQLNRHEQLMILSFYEELLALLYDNCNLFNFEL